MKNLWYVALFALALFTGCAVEDEPAEPQLAGGVWSLESANVQASGTAVIPGTQNSVPVSITGNGEDYDMTVVFGEDPNTVMAEGEFVFFVEVSVAGIPFADQRFPVQGTETFAGTWEINNDQLVMVDTDNDVFEMEILEFTENRLRVSGMPNVMDFSEFDMSGVTPGEATAEFVLVRQ
ncbi:lipocalin family protein [Cyclobacterium sp.]|uniref:lipocalin family protein n=1 Tax=Cyclobacterium sp. TaxID=1966343 RepID=UPI0019870578|nr:lipocalin family protein [Cyclobacterium sp.]MBD3628654.1 lipocalin family protein [Cyclobacterium sp.]